MIDVVLLSNLSYCRRSWPADVAATFDESGDELSATSVIEVNDPDGGIISGRGVYSRINSVVVCCSHDVGLNGFTRFGNRPNESDH
jgi:hypothetical protein